MSQPLRVAILGNGYATRTFHAPLVDCTEGLSLDAVSTRDPAKLAAERPSVRALPTPEAVFADPDIDLVVVPTPNDTHFPLARAALLAGKHVVVDKPFTLTVAEAQTLDALAREQGRLLSVFHNRRWDADFLALREVFKEGLLGRITHFESHFDRFRPQVRARWREAEGPGSGLWYDLGPHLIDQALQLFGEPERITVDLARQRDGALTDDWFHAVLHYGECRVILHGSALVAALGPRFAIHGTAGSLLKFGLDAQEDALKAGLAAGGAGWGLDPEPIRLTLQDGERLVPSLRNCPQGNYPAYYAAVRDAILVGAPNPVPAIEAIRVMRLVEAGSESARSHAAVSIKE
ncbi:oxidoreductase [Niveibacterium sp. SC-1]|uniref:oxidoreductase n=1 Tax=Niveibacterium sp. SC-1 TaxID=3135646 RepID=UPI00311DBC1C